MKCDELKSVYIDRTGDWVRSGNDTGEFYLTSEVDVAIAELKDDVRKAKRELWMHRAIIAKMNKEVCKVMHERNPFIGIEEYKWQEVERKCLKKAEQYK